MDRLVPGEFSLLLITSTYGVIPITVSEWKGRILRVHANLHFALGRKFTEVMDYLIHHGEFIRLDPWFSPKAYKKKKK